MKYEAQSDCTTKTTKVSDLSRLKCMKFGGGVSRKNEVFRRE
jgi:hypothetical protein